MSEENGNVTQLLTPAARDQQMLQLRLAGVSIGVIAQRFKVRPKKVLDALDALLPELNNETRARYMRESIAALDTLASWWWGQAKTSMGAAALCLKIQERRASLLGLDTPAHVKVDLVTEGAGPQQTSTEELLAALNRIASEPPLKLKYDPAIDPALDRHELDPDPPAA
jgi:hypothetical protein